MYFGQCLESSQYEKCPGEGEWTAELDTRCPILIQKRQPPEVACKSCERRYSKDGYFESETVLADTERVEEVDVLRVAQNVLWLDGIERTGFGDKYPVQPAITDWIGLVALADARAAHEAKLAKRDPSKPNTPIALTPEEDREEAMRRAAAQMQAVRARQQRG